jgi:hypothetical protein
VVVRKTPKEGVPADWLSIAPCFLMRRARASSESLAVLFELRSGNGLPSYIGVGSIGLICPGFQEVPPEQLFSSNEVVHEPRANHQILKSDTTCPSEVNLY